MICSFFTCEFSFHLSAGGSLESADLVGEEGALMIGGGVATAAATRGTNTGAVGRNDTALVGDPLGVAGAVTTACATGGNAVAVAGLEGPEFPIGAVFRPQLVLRPSIMEGINNHTLSPWSLSLILSHPALLSRWGYFRVTAEIEFAVPVWLRRFSFRGGRGGIFWNASGKP